MKNNAKPFLATLILFFTMSMLVAFDGNYTFQLESADQNTINSISNPKQGMMIFNTTKSKISFYDGNQWIDIDKPAISTDANNTLTEGSDGGIYLGPTVYTGVFIIDTNGTKTITGVPFKPSQITFVAHANVEELNLDSDNGIRNNDNTLQNAFGTMNGFARDDEGSITQQVIYIGGSANSINDISRFASSYLCIGLRYSNNNGDEVGKVTAKLKLFNNDGFTIDIFRSTQATNENVVVLYTAYR